MTVLHSKRLVIRNNIREDLPYLFELLSNKEVMKYLDDTYCKSVDEARRNLDISISESIKKNRKKFFFALIQKKTNVFIGEAGFTIFSQQIENGLAEYGCFLQKRFWGCGYASEATIKIADFAFVYLNIHKMIFRCVRDNYRSENMLKRLKLVKEAEFIQHVWHENMWKDRIDYRLLKNEWNDKMQAD